MEALTVLLRILLIVLSIVLVALLLIQVRGGNLNILGEGDSSFRVRRGIERWLFRGTVITGVLLVLVAVVTIRF